MLNLPTGTSVTLEDVDEHLQDHRLRNRASVSGEGWCVNRPNTLSRGLRWVVRRARVTRFRAMSSIPLLGATAVSPVLTVGTGSIVVQGSRLGFWPSPGLFDGYIHLEARHRKSMIEIGPRTTVNNGAVIISDGPGIVLGRDCLIGPGVQIYDSDFHALDQSNSDAPTRQGAVRVGDRVFVGASVIICKGVNIGDGSVIGAGSVVTSDIPPCSIAAGNPCRVIGRTGEAPLPAGPTGAVGPSTSPERSG